MSQEPENIVIRNLLLIDREGKTEDHQVNILIKDKKLFIVTLDDIELTAGMVVYDAGKSILLGNLDIGSPASFLIVNSDPRENIDVLLDTRAHIVFAIRDGTIIVNTLARDSSEQINETGKKTIRWLAYSPPPMALPLSYQDKSKWNRWDTKPFSGIFLAAVAIDRHRWLSQDENNEGQVGEIFDYNGGEIRAFRMGIGGTLNFKRPWIYTFVVATHAFDKGFDSKTGNKVTLLDYRLDIPIWKQISVSIGKQKEPISMERLLLGTQLQMQERPSGVDAMFPVRNVGISVNGTGFSQRISWAAGAFNDWFDDSQRFSESSTQLIGRVSGIPWTTEDETRLLHMGLGIRYTNGKEPLRYMASPEFNQSPVFVDTDSIDARRAFTYDLELSWLSGPLWISGELLLKDIKSSQSADPLFYGFHISGSYILTREMRSYVRRNGTFGPVPVSRSVYQGGPGAWELAARYSKIDLTNGKVEGGDMDIFSLGLNWWLTATFGVNLNYRYSVLHRYETQGGSHGLMARVVLVLE
jgi:phosphate-selective porin OprO/OprP